MSNWIDFIVGLISGITAFLVLAFVYGRIMEARKQLDFKINERIRNSKSLYDFGERLYEGEAKQRRFETSQTENLKLLCNIADVLADRNVKEKAAKK